MSAKLLKGSCHCKAVRYEVELDPHAGTTRCNCTICTKVGWWGAIVKPPAFRVTSGEDKLGDFSRSEYGHARFCSVCGVRLFGHGHIPDLGGDYVSVNLNTLDDVDLRGVPVLLLDGLHDTWAPLGNTVHESIFPAAK